MCIRSSGNVRPICTLPVSKRLAGLIQIVGVVGNRRSERKKLARRAALIQQGESVLGERGVELEVLGERFGNETLRRWTWGGVQAF